MPKYLLLNGETDFPQDWRLPDETDISDLRARLFQAMKLRELIQVPIEVGRPNASARTVLLVNPSKLASVAVIDVPG